MVLTCEKKHDLQETYSSFLGKNKKQDPPKAAEIKKQEQARRDYGERVRTDPEYHYKHAIRGKYQYKNGRLVRLEKGQSKADGLTYKQYLVLRKRGVDMPASVPP